ncbi:DUF3122 domain-containing protein [Phormidium pseudopriestleyi FRX01]|uniref:DUF3122 domain-containing protein n=1 Tax=Phormidium pseudopriestleyi FRX01 TaxID=1759528 RepID=A0ABS3FXT0_9CYAN|nr:DUF3122 domain-containing protein [Phormidium pseudopriestleyi]MBO0351952.1 DUF3122 domain-containing protein [Phormidium pseudopriestleyi FRX01]
MINLSVSPAQAVIRQLEEEPGQTVYQSEIYKSRQMLKDQQGNSWQAIAFERILPDHQDSIYLRLVAFPGTANIDHSQPLTITNSMSETLTAVDVSEDMFMDDTKMATNAGEYDLQPILMQLESAIPLRLILQTLDQQEIVLNVSPAVVEEWRSLTVQK